MRESVEVDAFRMGKGGTYKTVYRLMCTSDTHTTMSIAEKGSSDMITFDVPDKVIKAIYDERFKRTGD